MMLSTPVIAGSQDIGPYAVLEDLGPAPFGTAYLALDTRSDRTAILKVIPPSRPGMCQEITPWEILLEETAALTRIYHRGLPALFEVAEHEGSLLVAFEMIEGRTLHELLGQGVRPDRGQLIDWGCQVLDVLAEAHDEGLLHRHIGEDAVLLTPEGQVLLTGFGLTQLVFDPLTALSPEQLAGEPLSPQSDLYAVGSLLRRLTFASRLKSGGGVVSANGRDPLLKVLARATFPDPAARYRSAAEMAEALRQAGRARKAVPVPGLRAVASAKAAITAVGGRSEDGAVTPFPVAARPQVEESATGDRRWALLLLTVTLLLMLSVIATGWFLIGGDTLPEGHETPKTSVVLPSS
ncbi:MAG TPA: serine/threonine-protein kinase [Thermoanaerobaculia bacterium]|nr:serine/threonine-protein kinase [Thermoanaerobaculia bacterium]